jgi:arylformamidase
MPRGQTGGAFGAGRILDISLELYEGIPLAVPAGSARDLAFRLEVLKEYDAPGGAGQIVRGLHMRLHAGTHVDVPLHFVKGGLPLAEVPLETFVGEALVADLSHKGFNEPITVADLERAVGSSLRRGDRLLLRTDWSERYGEADWREGSPYLSPEAIDWCIARGPLLVGMDFLHAKDGPSTPCPEYTLRGFLEHGIIVLSYLNHLKQIRQERVTLVALPLSLAGAEASPVRAIVIQDA